MESRALCIHGFPGGQDALKAWGTEQPPRVYRHAHVRLLEADLPCGLQVWYFKDCGTLGCTIYQQAQVDLPKDGHRPTWL